MILPLPFWTVHRGKGRRFVAQRQNECIFLRGIRNQIEKHHFPYHIVKKRKLRWIKRKPAQRGSKLRGLKEGQKYDRNVERAICNGDDHPILTYFESQNLSPVAVKVFCTNANNNVRKEASCAEIDVVAWNRESECFACVEIKTSTKNVTQLEKEDVEAPVCRKTKRKRSFLDMARLQAQLGASFLQNTYGLDKTEAYLFLISNNDATNSVDKVNVFELENISEDKTKWIIGYDESE